MKITLLIAAALLLLVATTGNYGCGLFRFDAAHGGVGWRHLAVLYDFAGWAAIGCAYFAGRWS